jgi:hypothetical protein
MQVSTAQNFAAQTIDYVRSRLAGTAHDLPSTSPALRDGLRERTFRGFLPGKTAPRNLYQATTAKSLLDFRMLSAIYQESEYSDCQNTCDDANQCCRIHLMYPPFSRSRITGKL